MELNLQMQDELKRLSELSAKLKDVERFWTELYTDRIKAELSGAELHVLCNYSEQIRDAMFRIESLKDTIVEHVHILAGLYDAQLRTDGAKD